jgi:hypothetical protein
MSILLDTVFERDYYIPRKEDTMTEHITIRNPEDYLGYANALLRIQAIQREYIKRQVEEYGRLDDIDLAKADMEARGERV